MHNNLSNPFNPAQPLLFEGLKYKDLDGMMKSTVHVDEFASKMGDDDDVIVISFFVRDLGAAKDLVSWFEKGYDFVLDADRSPGEIKPNRYLVYVEIRRRSSAARHVNTLLNDLNTLTEFSLDDWIMHYEGRSQPWSEQAFEQAVPLTPDAYRQTHEGDLNEMRVAAGLPVKPVHRPTAAVRSMQVMAGII